MHVLDLQVQSCYSNLLQWSQLHIVSGFLIGQIFYYAIPLFVTYSTHLTELLSNATSIIIGNINVLDLCIGYCRCIMSWPKFVCIGIQISHFLFIHPLSMEHYNEGLKGKIVELFESEFTNIYFSYSVFVTEIVLSRSATKYLCLHLFHAFSLHRCTYLCLVCSLIWIAVCIGIFCTHIFFKNDTVWC